MNIYWIRGFIIIKPIRYLFWKMITNTEPRLLNIHWWLLYETVFKFFKWVYWDAWRMFCNWEGGWRRTYPLTARMIHSIGKITAGYAICGGGCYHCGSEYGDPVLLSEEESENCKIIETGVSATQNGTDYWFIAETICPMCGYKDEHRDGSL